MSDEPATYDDWMLLASAAVFCPADSRLAKIDTMTATEHCWHRRMSDGNFEHSRTSMKFLAVALFISLCASGCGQSPPTDVNGSLPDDVVRSFIELVQAKDYPSAQRLWYGQSKRIHEPKPFEDFCAQFMRIDLATATISKARAGKSGFWVVEIDWSEDNRPRRRFLGLKVIDGEWKMERGYEW